MPKSDADESTPLKRKGSIALYQMMEKKREYLKRQKIKDEGGEGNKDKEEAETEDDDDEEEEKDEKGAGDSSTPKTICYSP